MASMPFDDPSSFLFGLNQFASPPANSPSGTGASGSSSAHAARGRTDSLLGGLDGFGSDIGGPAPSAGSRAGAADEDASLLAQGSFAEQLALWTNANFSFDGPTGHALLAEDDKEKDKDKDNRRETDQEKADREADEADRRRAQAHASGRAADALAARDREARDDPTHREHQEQSLLAQQQHYFAPPSSRADEARRPGFETHGRDSEQRANAQPAPQHAQNHGAQQPSPYAHLTPAQQQNIQHMQATQAQMAAHFQAQLAQGAGAAAAPPFWNGMSNAPNPFQALMFNQPQHQQQQVQQAQQQPQQQHAPPPPPQQMQQQQQQQQHHGHHVQSPPPPPAGGVDLAGALALQQLISSNPLALASLGNMAAFSPQLAALLGQLNGMQNPAFGQPQAPAAPAVNHMQQQHAAPAPSLANFGSGLHGWTMPAGFGQPAPANGAMSPTVGPTFAPAAAPAPAAAAAASSTENSHDTSLESTAGANAGSSSKKKKVASRGHSRAASHSDEVVDDAEPNGGDASMRASPEASDRHESAEERARNAADRALARDEIPPLRLIDTGNPEADAEANRAAIEEDKRRRNTAASARFRIKKKQREAALEATSRDLRARVAELETENERLRTENGWLKGLIHVKPDQKPPGMAAGIVSNGAVAGPSRSVAGSTRIVPGPGNVPRPVMNGQTAANGVRAPNAAQPVRAPPASSQPAAPGVSAAPVRNLSTNGTATATPSTAQQTTVPRSRDSGLAPRGVGTEGAAPVAAAAAPASAPAGASKPAAPAVNGAAAAAAGLKRDREE